MQGRNKIPRALWLLLILSGFTFSEAQTLPKQVSKADRFVSVEGQFTISLPSPPDSVQNVEPIAGKTLGGRQYFWIKPQSAFTAGFVELYKPEYAKEVIETITGAMIRKTIAESGKLVAKKEISVQGQPGFEYTISLKAGVAVIGQYILAGSRIYTLSVAWRETESGIENLKVLDSFKIIDQKTALAGDAEIKAAQAKKIEDATPAPLPQTPSDKKLKSDAEDENLKGKVKSLIEESEPFSENGVAGQKSVTFSEEYDEKGRWLKRINYDSRGNPYIITVYGFIDGARVSNSKRIADDDDAPQVKAPNRVEEVGKPADPRYELRYEYKYVDGRLAELQVFSNRGGQEMRYTISYDGKRKERLALTPDGKINQKYLTIFDDKGVEIELTIFDFAEPKVYGDARYIIKHESFDAKGNWIKRTFSKLVVENGMEIYKPSFTKYRTITYYP